MTILGIDYGTRWLGLALGNTETKFAFPHKTLEQGESLISELSEICKKEDVKRVVIGVPMIWQGARNIQEETQRFGAELEARLNLPVTLAEEIFTSRFANSLAPRHAQHSTHAQAAALIVENYFSQSSNVKAQMTNQAQSSKSKTII